MTLDEENEMPLDQGEFSFAVDLHDMHFTKTKCTPCKISTVHEWAMIRPESVLETDPLETIKLHRRIIMCTECGNLSLKK